MASLQNAQIDQSYQGLIKTANNQAGAPFPPAALQYGDGTDLPITIGDGSGIGLGDMVTIASGFKNININATDLSLTGLTAINAGGATAQIFDGTYNFGNAFTTTNVDFSNATVTGLPSGGAALNALGGNLEGRMYYDSANPSDTYRTWVNTTGFSIGTATVSNRANYSLFTMVPAEQINKVAIQVNQAAVGATGEIAFYDTAINAAGFIYLNNRLQSLGTVDMSSTGWKEITLGTPYAVPSGLTNNTIAIVAFPSTTSANFGGWSNSMAMVGAGYFLTGGIPYRSIGLQANPGVSPGTALPATIGDAGGLVDYKASTSLPLAVMIN